MGAVCHQTRVKPEGPPGEVGVGNFRKRIPNILSSSAIANRDRIAAVKRHLNKVNRRGDANGLAQDTEQPRDVLPFGWSINV